MRTLIQEANAWQQARRMDQLILPANKKKWKTANLIKTTKRGHIPLVLSPGIYICGAVSRQRLGHMFVLEVAKDRELLVHDSALGKVVPYTAEFCVWIYNWCFIIQCSKQ